MLHVFIESNKALFILSEPGSGKTLALLELAQELIKSARKDSSI